MTPWLAMMLGGVLFILGVLLSMSLSLDWWEAKRSLD
jgi:hypothetical protein